MLTSKFHGKPEFIADARRSGGLGFDSGGTVVGAVAACRAVDAGFLGPGLASPSLGSIGQGPRGSGDGEDAVDSRCVQAIALTRRRPRG